MGSAKVTRKGKKLVVRIVNPESTPLAGVVDKYVHTEDSGITVPKMDLGTNQWLGTSIRCTKHDSATGFGRIALQGILVGTRVRGAAPLHPRDVRRGRA